MDPQTPINPQTPNEADTSGPVPPQPGVIHPTEPVALEAEGVPETLPRADASELQDFDFAKLVADEEAQTAPQPQPLVKPSEPVQPRSMPAFMQPNGQSKPITVNNITHAAPTPGPVSPDPTHRGQEALRQDPAAVVVKKSRTLAIVLTIIILLLLVGGGAAAYVLTRPDEPAPVTANIDDSQQSADDEPEPAVEQETIRKQTVASSISDFRAVCEGGAISNATAYTTNKAAVVAAMSNNPAKTDSWQTSYVGNGKSYYPDIENYKDISVVGCVKYIDDSAKLGKSCEYDKDDQVVTIKYNAVKYALTFYEAKTGEKIQDGGDIPGPADKCPMVVSYDPNTKIAYADADDKALEAALDLFVK